MLVAVMAAAFGGASVFVVLMTVRGLDRIEPVGHTAQDADRDDTRAIYRQANPPEFYELLDRWNSRGVDW